MEKIHQIGLWQLFTGLGKKVYVKAKHDQPSLFDPELKSVVTDPIVLQDIEVTYDQFCEELVAYCKDPLFPMEELVVKSVEVTDIDEDSFYIKVIHDGLKLQRWGYGSGEDAIRSWCKIHWNRKTRTVTSEDYNADGSMNGGCIVRFTEELPFRIDFVIMGADGTRGSDEAAALFLQDFYMNPILDQLAKTKVHVLPDQESPSLAGQKSVISTAMDDFTNFDELFTGLLDVLIENYKGPKTQIEENEFTLTPDEVDAKRVALKVVSDKMRGEFYVVSHVENELLHTAFTKILHNPLRVESWVEDGATRVHGKTYAKKIQSNINQFLRKIESGWYW